jgi:hypothetical protein
MCASLYHSNGASMQTSKKTSQRRWLGVTVGISLVAADSAMAAWTLVPSPNGSGRQSMLRAVAALSPNDVWAVGFATPADSGAPETLIEHWDGQTWSVVPSPNRTGRDAQNALYGVAAVAPDDAWGVGYSVDLDSPSIYSTLTLHWDGDSWSIVPSPNLEQGPHAYNALLAVSAIASDDIWAVGGAPVADSGLAIFMHWDGVAWSLFPAPPGIGYYDRSRFSVAAIASDNAWSVGGGESTHWDGVSWSVVGGAQSEAAIAAADSTGVWAVGSYITYDEGEYFGPFTKTAHWDGSRWLSIHSQSPLWDDNFVGVAAVSGSDAWAVGRTGRFTLAEHWDGAAWSVVSSPNGNPNPPSTRQDPNQLLAASALSSDDVWAVGYFYENDGFTQRTMIMHWDGSASPQGN